MPSSTTFTKKSGSLLLNNFLETAQVIIISLAIVFLVRSYLIQPFLVKGASMEPNFQDGNYLIIDELSYKIRAPERGEVIVFHYPRDPKQYFIKRIIGLPNERVEIKNQEVRIYNKDNPNGQKVDEKYLPADIITRGNLTEQLGSNEYFVLGDNRQASSDSRVWGSLPAENIVGRTLVRAWPIEQAKIY